MREIPVAEHVLYKICNTPKQRYPFSHFFVRDVFPTAFYNQMLDHLDQKNDYQTHGGRYPGRTFAESVDVPGLEFMGSGRFAQKILHFFADDVRERYRGVDLRLFADLRLIRDHESYKIGPHTDAPWKLVSLLFYLPRNDAYREHGTSLYVPKDPAFRCVGGPHHKFDDFERVFTAPFVPNSCLGFWKTDASFHGVEQIEEAIRRDLLLFNIYDEQLYLRTHQTAPRTQEG